MAEQHFGPDARPWEQLKQAFLARLHTPSSASSATETWRLFADDPWFQQLLETRARRALLSRAGRLDWLGDVKHEALLALARQLAKTPDLRVNLDLVNQTFPGWIGAIIDRACGDAIRWLARLHRLQAETLEKIADPVDRLAADTRIDVSVAIGLQEEPYRTLLFLSAKGYSIQEIADRLDLTYWETYRRLNAGIARVRRRLSSYGPERKRPERSLPLSSSSAMTG